MKKRLEEMLDGAFLEPFVIKHPLAYYGCTLLEYGISNDENGSCVYAEFLGENEEDMERCFDLWFTFVLLRPELEKEISFHGYFFSSGTCKKEDEGLS